MLSGKTGHLILVCAYTKTGSLVLQEDSEEIDDSSMEDIEEPVAWERPAGVGMPGQLKTLTLVNFMCHEHLSVDFG